MCEVTAAPVLSNVFVRTGERGFFCTVNRSHRWTAEVMLANSWATRSFTGAISLSHRLTGLSGFAFVIRKTDNEIEVFVFTHMIKWLIVTAINHKTVSVERWKESLKSSQAFQPALKIRFFSSSHLQVLSKWCWLLFVSNVFKWLGINCAFKTSVCVAY